MTPGTPRRSRHHGGTCVLLLDYLDPAFQSLSFKWPGRTIQNDPGGMHGPKPRLPRDSSVVANISSAHQTCRLSGGQVAASRPVFMPRRSGSELQEAPCVVGNQGAGQPGRQEDEAPPEAPTGAVAAALSLEPSTGHHGTNPARAQTTATKKRMSLGVPSPRCGQAPPDTPWASQHLQ